MQVQTDACNWILMNISYNDVVYASMLSSVCGAWCFLDSVSKMQPHPKANCFSKVLVKNTRALHESDKQAIFQGFPPFGVAQGGRTYPPDIVSMIPELWASLLCPLPRIPPLIYGALAMFGLSSLYLLLNWLAVGDFRLMLGQ